MQEQHSDHVARELGYDHTPHLMRILDADEKGVHGMDTLTVSTAKAIALRTPKLSMNPSVPGEGQRPQCDELQRRD
jgi:hypothetical protein